MTIHNDNNNSAISARSAVKPGQGDRKGVLLDRAGLDRIAEELWRDLPRGAVVWLTGPVGAGKTTFVQALARAAGAEQPALSPTFTLVHEYSAPEGSLVHVDCYRLREPIEALDLDFPGLGRDARLVAIEWPERAGTYAPAPDAHLAFEHADRPDRRRVERVA